jgi:hypothetical protein
MKACKTQKTKSAAPASLWLLLIRQLPPKPASLRVKIWRRLQGLGAISVKSSGQRIAASLVVRALMAQRDGHSTNRRNCRTVIYRREIPHINCFKQYTGSLRAPAHDP